MFHNFSDELHAQMKTHKPQRSIQKRDWWWLKWNCVRFARKHIDNMNLSMNSMNVREATKFECSNVQCSTTLLNFSSPQVHRLFMETSPTISMKLTVHRNLLLLRRTCRRDPLDYGILLRLHHLPSLWQPRRLRHKLLFSPHRTRPHKPWKFAWTSRPRLDSRNIQRQCQRFVTFCDRSNTHFVRVIFQG